MAGTPEWAVAAGSMAGRGRRSGGVLTRLARKFPILQFVTEYDSDAFDAFEEAGWTTTDASAYHRLLGGVTPQVAEPLLDAVDAHRASLVQHHPGPADRPDLRLGLITFKPPAPKLGGRLSGSNTMVGVHATSGAAHPSPRRPHHSEHVGLRRASTARTCDRDGRHGDRPAVIRAAFATREFDGVLGCWSFDASGDIDLRCATRLIVENGRVEPLGVLSIKV